jgi:hypothetical protein
MMGEILVALGMVMLVYTGTILSGPQEDFVWILLSLISGVALIEWGVEIRRRNGAF